jgi:prepilin-type N-terminal cleavage/methylation domain-containing protein
MMVQKMKKKKIDGFTLIELIVVIAILGILAVIAIPRFTGMRKNANESAVIANLRNIQNAAEMYATQENKEIHEVTKENIESILDVWPDGPGVVEYSFETNATAGTGDATASNTDQIPYPDGGVTKYSDIGTETGGGGGGT